VAPVLIEMMLIGMIQVKRVAACLIGAVDEGPLDGVRGGVFGLKGTRGQPRYGGILAGRDLVKMDPAVGFAIEVDGVVCNEKEFWCSVGDVGKDAARFAWLG
jgi:hypothetical protein